MGVDLEPNGRLEVRRGTVITLVLAMGNTPVRLPPGQLLLASTPLATDTLPPDTTAWLRS
ncbi:MAG: hypothetical protein M3332_05975 [Actinomycetota bacterium]|nr:hypothetical protein [Actinomycetota bacterium]